MLAWQVKISNKTKQNADYGAAGRTVDLGSRQGCEVLVFIQLILFARSVCEREIERERERLRNWPQGTFLLK